MRNKWLRAIFGTVVLLPVFALPGPVAGATEMTSLVVKECLLAFELDLSPALTNTVMPVDAQGMAGVVGCVGLTDSSGARLLSATVTGTNATATATVLPAVGCLLLTISGSAKIVWNTDSNTKATTAFDFVINVNPSNGAVTLAADSTGGAAHPFHITAAPVTAAIEGTCLTGGIKRLFAPNAVLLFT